MAGEVIGRAASSLGNSAGWSDNAAAAKVGVRGELSTAKILNTLAAMPDGPTVMHDLRIPIPGVSANIDHLVISGRTVTIIDSKVWKPGFYWTLGGRTWRGRERFAPADKRTIPMAVDAIAGLLHREGVRSRLARPLLVVWPSNARSAMSLMFLRSPGAAAMSGERFESRVTALIGLRKADPKIVEALRGLAITAPKNSRPARTVEFGPGEL
tara:strand:+ start:318 stop:953 length:636 start_codon:yes stop_codon:yes gene_type:complete